MDVRYDKTFEGGEFCITATAKEVRDIWFALHEYKNMLLKEAYTGEIMVDGKPHMNTIEDEVFQLESAARLAKLQFDIRFDHSGDQLELITCALGVD